MTAPTGGGLEFREVTDMAIRLGCFTRPWNGYTFEDFLAGTAAAGYEVAGTMALNKELVISADLTDDEVS